MQLYTTYNDNHSYYTTDDMRNVHKMIINDVSQMVGRLTITFDHHRILVEPFSSFEHWFLEPQSTNGTINNVAIHRVHIRDFQPYHILLSIGFVTLDFVIGQARTCSIIIRWKAKLSPMFGKGSQTFLGAKAFVGETLVQQPVRMPGIDSIPFGLRTHEILHSRPRYAKPRTCL